MINPRILFIVFGVITIASVAILILYDQYERQLEWQEKAGPLLTRDGSAMLEKVLDSCNYTGEKRDDMRIAWGNETHYMDTKYCEMSQIGNHSGLESLELVLDSCECQASGDDCFSYGAEFNNGTHYIDNTECVWIIYHDWNDTYDEDFTEDFEIDYTEKFD